MAAVKPMLGDVELQQVQKIEIDGDQVLVEHGVPALEGDFLQRLNRRTTQITLNGVLTGSAVADQLKTLREKFRAAEPVAFVADIATATKVDQVLIGAMGVRELAGKPERFEYAFTLREYRMAAAPVAKKIQPVEAQTQKEADEITSRQVAEIVNGLGSLEVQVDLENGGDYNGVVVIVEGETSEGEAFTARSEDQVDGLYRFTNIQAGAYTVRVEIQ